MDNRPRAKIKQKEVRTKKFSHNQYWCVSYTECYTTGAERDFKTIIKARSSQLAKEILISRLKEDKNFLKVRSVTTSMVHNCWHIADLRKKLSIKQWAAIRNIAFPNDWNKIFKFEKQRIKGQFNRYNVPHTILSKEHKAKLAKACEKLVNKYIKGSFKPLCPALRKICATDKYCKEDGQRRHFTNLRNLEHAQMELTFLKEAMTKYHGNIQFCADALNVHRSCFRRALGRFPDVDWEREFPLTYTRAPKQNSMDSPQSRAKLANTLREMGHRPPPNKKGTPQYAKWLKAITPTLKTKKEKLYSGWKDRLVTALREHAHKRTETAEALGISVGYMNRLMNRFAKEDSEFEKEFWSPEISLRLKNEACKRTRQQNRLAFIKENKHLILQAYYQYGQEDCKAAKIFKVDTRTFTRWRKEIEQHEV